MFFGDDDLQPPNQECKTWADYMKLLALIVLGFALAKLIVMKGLDGFTDLMLALALFCGANTYNYCLSVFFILMAFFPLITAITIIGGMIQQGKSLFGGANTAVTIIYGTSLILYCIGIHRCNHRLLCCVPVVSSIQVSLGEWTDRCRNGRRHDGWWYDGRRRIPSGSSRTEC